MLRVQVQWDYTRKNFCEGCDAALYAGTTVAIRFVMYTTLMTLLYSSYRAMLCIRGLAMGLCPSVTSRSSTKMAKCRIT